MKVNPLFFVLIAGLVSCNTDVVVQRWVSSPVSTIAPPNDITSEVKSMEVPSETGPMQSFMIWEAVEGATGYVVSYGKTRDYGTSVETIKPVIVITGLEKDTTYYFQVWTKNGKAVSSLPKNIVISTAMEYPSVSDPAVPDDEIPKQPASAEDNSAQPFDSAVFTAEKAAWEAQNISDYLFVIQDYAGMPSYPAEIYVSSNKVSGIEYYTFSYEQEKPSLPYGETIDAMFAAIAAEVGHTEYAFRITYNAQYHYPEYFSISIVPPAGETIDGGSYWFEITSFTANPRVVFGWPVEKPVQDIDMKPFDIAVFNTQRAAWEAEHPSSYSFNYTHEGQPGIYRAGTTTVPAWPAFEGTSGGGSISTAPLVEPPLVCGTLSELYEKIAALWAEQRYTAASFLIKYNETHSYPYPSVIQIKNFNNSGYDYTLHIWAQFSGDEFPGW
jgi:hypothetical protein